MPKRIQKIEDLKALASKDGGADFFIVIGGYARSSKHIDWDSEDKTFGVTNEIDGSFQELTEDQLMNREYTNIGYAMLRGAFFSDED